MVGRDIGTVVLPDADLKIYLDATLHERARRRFLERQQRGEQVTFEQVLATSSAATGAIPRASMRRSRPPTTRYSSKPPG